MAATSGDAVIEALRVEIASLRAENAALLRRLAELERRLGLNSSNSGKPPSSDGLKKPPRVSSLREPSGKKTGGAEGPSGRDVAPDRNPRRHHRSLSRACTACGEPLSVAMAAGHVARQVFDLAAPPPLI